MNDEVIDDLLQAPAPFDPNAPPHTGLTPRQSAVLRLVLEGKKNREVAELLQISEKTIETHRAAINKRLNVHNQSELFLYASQHGLLSTTPPKAPTPGRSFNEERTDVITWLMSPRASNLWIHGGRAALVDALARGEHQGAATSVPTK